MKLEPGDIFASYEIRGEVGRGAMGVVYRAWDPALDREIALKVVADHLAQDPEFRGRFAREAQTAARVEHPGVVTIYQSGEHAGIPFIAMRLVEGRDLAALVETRGRIPLSEALSILSPIAEGLDEAHAAGIVHRDVKPGNILVPPGGRGAVLVDFGIGRLLSGTRATQTGGVVGTVEYMAPEQIRGGDIDGRADQYSLACVLFEMITGSSPFVRPDTVQVLFAHANDSPPTVVTGNSADDERATRAISRALSKTPSDRFPSCSSMLMAGAGTAAPSVLSAGPTGTVVSGLDPLKPVRTGTVVEGRTSQELPTENKPAPPRAHQKDRKPVVVITLVAGLLAIAGASAAVVSVLGGAGDSASSASAGAVGIANECSAAREASTRAAAALQKVQTGMRATPNDEWGQIRRQVIDARTQVDDCLKTNEAAASARKAILLLTRGQEGMDRVRTKWGSDAQFESEQDCITYTKISNINQTDDAIAAYCAENWSKGYPSNPETVTSKAGARQAQAAGADLEALAIEDNYLR